MRIILDDEEELIMSESNIYGAFERLIESYTESDDPQRGKVGKSVKQAVLDVFDFWNLFKGKGKWWSHRKLSHDIINAIMMNLSCDYSVEDICTAIDNYAKVLIGDEYFWDYSWSLSTFLTVKYERNKNSAKKWWQFLSNNFIEENYLIDKNGNSKFLNDSDSELTQEIIREFALFINNKDFVPNGTQQVKFIETTRKMISFFKDKDITKKNWVKYLFKCLEKNYTNEGAPVYPGHLCSEFTWNILMCQFLAELGIEYIGPVI